jgi:membrane-bound metal-dependent hydrolase YbcI (DUF457 family)
VPSPIGHALAGTAIAWAGDALDRRSSSSRFVVTCAVLAAAPDLDLLLPIAHRTVTHSVTAVAAVFIVAMAVTGGVRRRRAREHHASLGAASAGRVALLCAVAWASHPLLDWLGTDTLPPFGVQAFWPFDSRFFVSGLDVFAETERRNAFSSPTLYQNLWAGAQEVAIVGSVLAALWLVRVKALARLPAKMTGRDEPT